MSLLEALTIIFKHKRVIAVVFLSVVTAAVTGTLVKKPVFEAKSSLLVKMLKDDTSRPGMGIDNSSPRVSLSQDELINTEIQILTGRELTEKVIGTLQLENVYPDLAKRSGNQTELMDQAVLTFGEKLRVSGVRKSNVITLSFQHNNPEIAARAVNLLVEAFKDKHLALHSDPQSSFISSQLASFEEKLRKSERSLQEYQQNNKVFSLEEQRSLLLKQRNEFDSTMKIAYDNIQENIKKVASIKSQMKYMANNDVRYTPTDRDNIIIDAKSKLLELQLKEQELRRKYTEKNRLVVDARRELEIVNNFLKEQEEGIVGKVKTGNPVYQNMETDLFRAQADLNSQAAKVNALRDQLRQIDKEIAALDMSESKIQNLKRELAINEKNFKAYADRHEEARLSDAMNRLRLSNISIIQTAVVPVKPVNQRKILDILVGILFGIVSSLGCAYFLEKFGQTFSNPESVEKYLELPVLITVPDKEA